MKRHFTPNSSQERDPKRKKDSAASSWQSFNASKNKKAQDSAATDQQKQAPKSVDKSTLEHHEKPTETAQPETKKSGLSVEMHPALQALLNSGGSALDKQKHAAPVVPKPDFATVKANVRAASELIKTAHSAPAKPVKKNVQELKKAGVPSEFYNPAKNPYFDPKLTTKSMIAPRERKAKTLQLVQRKYLNLKFRWKIHCSRCSIKSCK